MVFFSGVTGVWNEVLEFTKQVLYHLSHTFNPFCCGYFEDGFSWTICLGWPQTTILLTLASQVVRITKVSHQCPASMMHFYLFIYLFIYCGTGAWTQGLHLESLHQLFFVKCFLEMGSHELFVGDWLWPITLLLSAFWVARIRGSSHRRQAHNVLLNGKCKVQSTQPLALCKGERVCIGLPYTDLHFYFWSRTPGLKWAFCLSLLSSQD
jgi:hypothetical protein